MSARYAVYICDGCGAPILMHESDTKLPEARDEDAGPAFKDQRETLGVCGLVHEGHGGAEECQGTVEHSGWITLERPQ